MLILTFIQGLGAGICFDVATVKLPTRRRIGIMAYATFARNNDLGNGLKVYPFVVVGGALVILTFAIAAHIISNQLKYSTPLRYCNIRCWLSFLNSKSSPNNVVFKKYKR